MKKILLKIVGMTCSACSNGLEKYLNKQDGIENASVNLEAKNAEITLKTDVPNDALKSAVEEAGYEVIEIE